ncbi:MAG: hypothetical protein PHX57_13845, partial [Desulfobulbaceae bacterium]|nr:hypothetical protein [Desulfobulbaceae bacterium]
DVVELYSVHVTGGKAARLNDSLTRSVDVLSFAVSPDNSRVIYLADQETDALIELYAVAMGGGGAVKLNSPLTPGGSVSSFAVSPDGGSVLYLAPSQTGADELFSVPLAGGAATRVNGPLAAGGFVYPDFAVSADSRRIIYRAHQHTSGVAELYARPTAPSRD